MGFYERDEHRCQVYEGADIVLAMCVRGVRGNLRMGATHLALFLAQDE